MLKSRFNLSNSRFGQVYFTFSQVLKLIFKITPRYLILVLILNTLWGLTTLPALYIDKLILDRIVANIGNSDWQLSLRVIAGLLLIRVFIDIIRNFLSRISNFLRRIIARLFSSGLSILLGQKLAELDIATLDDIEFKNRFNKIEQESSQRAWNLTMPLFSIPNYVVGFFGALGLLVLLSPLIAILILFISLPQFLVNSKFIKREYSMRTELSPVYRLWNWLEWYLVRNKNFAEVKILGISPYLSTKLQEVIDLDHRRQVELGKSREINYSMVYFPTAIVEAGLYIWFVTLTLTQMITVGSLQMYIQALRTAQQNLQSLVSSFLEIYENYLYVVDLVWFLNLKPVINNSESSVSLPRLDEEIRFENVWFRYREDTPWILRDINLTIKPGERLAIVGENGAGKSTLIKLLARFYDPQKGNIFVGKTNLKDINLKEWHDRLAILFQKFELYPFSVRESIGYGDIARMNDLDEIQESAKKTGIHDYIENLPLKYENPLAVDFERGIDPSIGQWQRIGISRMLFRKNADLLILDEPTSNVDPKAEEEIFGNLRNKTKDKILIFISQRFSTVRDADQIIVIDKGKISEEGTHDKLMQKKGTYEHLFNLQAKGYQ